MARKRTTEERVYDFVCKNPGTCTYEIAKKLKMSGGRVRHALNQLNSKGLVRFKFVRTNPRIKKLSYPVDAWSLVPTKLKKSLKRIKVKKR